MSEERPECLIYTVDEAAVLLRMTVDELLDLMGQGRIAYIQLFGKQRIRQSDMMRFINSCTPVNIS